MRIRSKSVTILMILGCVAFSFAGLFPRSFTQAQPPRRQLEARVENTVREPGTIESARSVELRCEVIGGSTILFVVPEGSPVEKGDLLVELDDSRLRDTMAAAKIKVEQSKAELIQSDAELEAVKETGRGMLYIAEKALQVEELARERVLGKGGELAYEIAVTNSELAIAEEQLKVAKNLITSAAGERGGNSTAELRLEIFAASQTIKVAQARKQLLEGSVRDYRTAMLNLALAEKQLELTRRKSDLKRAQQLAEANLFANQSALDQAEQELDQIQQQITRCKIHAPHAGMVVYASGGTGRTSRAAATEEGAQVRERQPIVQIPDLSNLRAKVLVNETRIARVRVGQSARILVDAFPGKVLTGKVIQISDIPQPASWLAGDVKEYAVLVSIDGPTELLRIGMTAVVEIDAGNSSGK